MQPSPYRLGSKQIAIVLLLFGFSVMSYFDRTIMSIAGPDIMREYGLSETQMGTVYSAFIAAYAVLMIPGGHVADVLGPRMTLLLMGALAGLFTGLTPLTGRAGIGALFGAFPALIAVRLALGAVTAPLYPACARMSGNWIPMIHQARVQGFVIAGSSLGGAVSPLLFSWLMRVYGWKPAFGFAAVATAGLAAVWYVYVRDHPPGIEKPLVERAPAFTLADFRRLLGNRNLMLITFSYLTIGYFDYIFFYWIYYYFGKVRNMGPEQSARYTTILFLTMALMMPLGGWVSDRLTRSHGARVGRRMVPMAAMALCGLLLVVGTNAQGTLLTVASLSLAIGFASCVEGPFWASATEMGGRNVGAAGGILNAGGNVGGFVAPVATPLIASFFGWSWGLYSGTVMVMLGVVACWFFDPRTTLKDELSISMAAAVPSGNPSHAAP
jgi:MFS family permease